jgi:hypothetical protein
MQSEDKRFDRLLDYTKFHIGIYLSIGGGLMALLGSKEIAYVRDLIGSPWALLGGLICMGIAGMAGGVIASSCTQFVDFDTFWTGKVKQGPYKFKWMTGQAWAFLEHSAFWIGIGLMVWTVLTSKSVSTWL